MLFRTEIDIPKADFEIQPAEQMLFVGSCFADNLGRRFVENRFRATVNPFGVMYNPASILIRWRRAWMFIHGLRSLRWGQTMCIY